MARVFAVQVELSRGIRVSWHNLQGGCEIVMLCRICLGSTAQCRGRGCLEARKLSWLQDFMASSARIRVQLSLGICLGSRMLFAKTVTSDLPLLTVLYVGLVLKLS